MLKYAQARALEVQKGTAENLPYGDETFDYAAFITSICFVDDPVRAITEAYRILKKEGIIIVAILDKETEFGKSIE